MMKYDPLIHHRRSIRLKNYDYSEPGAYFVTMVTRDRENIFGEIVGGVMKPNRHAEIVQRVWDDLPHHYVNITLDFFVIMPNHIHGIIVINSNEACRGGSTLDNWVFDRKTLIDSMGLEYALKTRPYSHGLQEVIRAFKSFSARSINNLRRTKGQAVWQRNYYERIIRNQREMDALRAYIVDNPRKWIEDVDYKV